ncbi:TldD/PmbA family protein [Rhodobaculum claviforme]|uniref:Modulator protein n=1 Tax=Rhodobaculum claviforme TaxID=1549854 RepID=A0A934TLA0_9RHOB|nr:metallopeptidase TldD-related protein [Rhodobaculum claviforme]MBK5927624.1 modulator protein [Rhodobaculum claviforme]
MTDTLAPLTEALLDAARKAGAEAADALAIEGRSLAIDVRAGQLEQAERAEGVEIGLRVLIGRRQACVSASDTRPDTLHEMAARAVAMAREAPEDPHVGLADADALSALRDADGLELIDPAGDPAPAALEDAARTAEAAALAIEGISMVESASAGWGWQAVHMAASNGFSGGYARTGSSLSCVAITGEGTGMERDWCAESRIFAADLPGPDDIGRRAAERTLARRGARKPPTGAWPVLFDERVAASLIGHLLAAVNGTAVARGASWLRDAMGAQVLPSGLSVIEDPRAVRLAASRPFDGEGLPTARRAIVEDGVLRSWVLDLATGRQLGLPSTANAARGTSAPPAPAPGNIILTPGRHSREALIAEMGRGLVVTSMLGASINPTTGDYSRGAAGFWVEGGEVVHAVNECTIAGNLRDMLHGLVPANDARAHATRQVPSLLVDGLTIAGA